MIEIIKSFIHKLVNLNFDGDSFYADPTHRVTIVALANGNARFDHSTLVGETWEPLSTIELEVGRRFWGGVVQVIRAHTGIEFTLPDGLVAGAIVVALPGADALAQDRPLEKPAPLKGKTTAAKRTTTKRATTA